MISGYLVQEVSDQLIFRLRSVSSEYLDQEVSESKYLDQEVSEQ